MTGAITVMFFLTNTYLFAINPSDVNNYAWKSRSVYPGNIDCIKYNNSLGIFCLSNFSFEPCIRFAIIIPNYVNIIYANISPTTLQLTYNYTGPNWTLQLGFQN